MLRLENIREYFPPYLANEPGFQKYLLKEYIQLLILSYLADSPWLPKLSFIGGTHLRLVKGIDRFSEDLDFDCKDLTRDDFFRMGDEIIRFLRKYGYAAEAKDRPNPNLSAFRRSIYFPELFFSLGISPHRDERFLIKIEAEDQGIAYTPQITQIQGCGLFFPFRIPNDAVMLSMKLSALLTRAKGRDFYDVIFLSARTKPDYAFLAQRMGIHDENELREKILNLLNSTNLSHKAQDLSHLLFQPENARRILAFQEIVFKNWGW